MHIKKAIRDEIVSILMNVTPAGANVFASKVYPLTKQQLPAICVYTLNENIDHLTLGKPRRQERTIELGIDIFVRANDSYDDDIDAIQVVVEQVLYNAKINSITQLDLTSTSLSLSNEGDQTTGRLAMTFDAYCHTIEGDAETIV